ncbi:MAG: CPBP family intramembrane metalloprotease [Candidatus Thermoplasmatota archaeon]|nr:CPBP family intramembrane metalloprotease [Candidatus Thermoplasmatota archaeon]
MALIPSPYSKGTEEELMTDPVWNGVPPVGKRPVTNRKRFLLMILLVFIIKIIIWGIYRYITGNASLFTNPDFGNELTYWVGMVAKPVLQLAPVFLLWWFLFKEKGIPFRFTRKNIASSLAWGLLGAILFFTISTVSMSIVLKLFGFGENFRIVAGWDDVGWGLVIAMMFSYMIGTGPAEELFSRGFLQDQTARAYPLWFAMGFSAVLFAAGHLPISILMHRMSFEAIIWYMLILFVMGMFFSLIYQWSRNILLPILIHGLWDWYLTLFSLKGDYSEGFIANSEILFLRVDFLNTLITLSIMLPIFYFLYIRFWRRDHLSTGSPQERKKKDNAVFRWLKERDLGNWPARPWITVISVTTVFCLLMIPAAAIVGVDDTSKFSDGIKDFKGDPVEVRVWEKMMVSGYLGEGEDTNIELDRNTSVITKVNVSLIWEDEPDAGFRYTNTPDQFQITLLDGEGNEIRTHQSGTGRSSIVWISPDETIDGGNLSVQIRMVRAGDHEPLVSFLGLRNINDEGNDYSLMVDYELLSITYEGEEQKADVRW